MHRLLHIDASPRSHRSRSRPVATALAGELQRSHGVAVTPLDLWRHAMPTLGGGMIEGRYARIMGQSIYADNADMAKVWDEADRQAREFLSYDGYLIATPMWNFGVPHVLKHYIDVITQPDLLFTNNASGAVAGQAAGRPAMIVAASAMPIADGGNPAETFDFQLSYLRAWLGFIGVTDIRSLRVAPTHGAEADVQAVVDAAALSARALAEDFAQALKAVRE
ncbi:MAG: NAD(P)H-dependent oxidoreductase [Sandarakinorhabdus sp.]|nr:NAD(P)H-dependent oxidoreductase [Sandarakinorhabdus sp.]